jgi:hypothetical protein
MEMSVPVIMVTARPVMLLRCSAALGLGLRGRGRRHIVMMEAKEALDEEHEQEAAEQPEHDRPDEIVTEFMGMLVDVIMPGPKPIGSRHDRVRQHVQQPDAQHHACHETHRQLHAPVCQSHEYRNQPAAQRGGDDQRAVEKEPGGGGHDASNR